MNLLVLSAENCFELKIRTTLEVQNFLFRSFFIVRIYQDHERRCQNRSGSARIGNIMKKAISETLITSKAFLARFELSST